MKALRCVAVALTLACAPVAASAAPIPYAVEFDGSVWGSAGTGSFLYDADTGIMTDFVWDFGAGLTTGGFDDSVLALADVVPGLSGTFGSIVFSVLTESPAVLPFIALANVGSFPSPSAGFCSAGAHANCAITDGAGAPTYLFPVSAEEGAEWFRGVVSVSRAVSVPEPATIALLGMGLAGLSLIARRRAEQP